MRVRPLRSRPPRPAATTPPGAVVEFRTWGAITLGAALIALPALFGLRGPLRSWPALDRATELIAVAGLPLGALLVARLLLLVRRSRRLAVDTDLRYGGLVANLPAVTYTLAFDPNVEASPLLFVSPQIEEVTGFAVARWHEDDSLWLRCLHPDDRARVTRAVAEARTARKGFEAEYRFVREDGEVVWVHDKSTPVYPADADDESAPLYLQGFFIDVSDRKRAELDREQLELELRLAQKLEAVGQLASGIAHEINTPVQFVSDSAHFLQDCFEELIDLVAAYRSAVDEIGDALPPPARARLAEAESQADIDYLAERAPAAFARTFDGLGRVAKIVRAMKEFAHPPSADKAPADLNAALQSALVVATNELKYVADVETDLRDLPPVVCHLSDLNQVFLNLVVNAAHAIDATSGEGGRGRITVRSRQEGGDAVIEIEDTGGGIAAEHRDRIFEPFFTTKEVGKGTGQGLALAHTVVVERHGGTLDFTTEVGVGTTFVIRIPVDGGCPDEETLAA